MTTISPSFYNPGSQAELTSPPDLSNFDTADTSKNGVIEEIELRSFLRNLGYKDAKIDTVIGFLFTNVFTNGKTSLDRAEFDELVSSLMPELSGVMEGNPGYQAALTSPPDSNFVTADTNKSGGIEEIELRSFLINLGYTDAQIDTVIGSLFTNGKTYLNRAEFDTLVSELMPKLSGVMEGDPGYQAALTSPPDSNFDTADTSGNGGIGKKELRAFLRNFDSYYTDEQIDDVIAGLFADGKTSLNRAEFDKFLSSRMSKGFGKLKAETAAQN